MSETCLGSSQLALLIFSAIFGTLALCFVFLFILWHFARTRPNFLNKILNIEKSSNENCQKFPTSSATTATVHPVDKCAKSTIENEKFESKTPAYKNNNHTTTNVEIVTEIKSSNLKIPERIQEEELNEKNVHGGLNSTTESLADTDSNPPSLPLDSPPLSSSLASESIAPSLTIINNNSNNTMNNDNDIQSNINNKEINNSLNTTQILNNINSNFLNKSSKLDDFPMVEKNKSSYMSEAILSTEQYNTLETNRKRLETERQQLRQLGII